MSRLAAIVLLAIGLVGCDAISTLTDGFKYAKAVESDLQKVTGIAPRVGFNWKNGRLVEVTVMFPRLYDAKPIGELAAAVRNAVISEFKQKPDNILLTFVIGPAAAAQSSTPPATTRQAAL
jgi:hypothetical protein